MNNLTREQFLQYVKRLNGRKDDIVNNYLVSAFVFANCKNIHNKILRKEFVSKLILSTFTYEDIAFDVIWKDNLVDETFISFQEIK